MDEANTIDMNPLNSVDYWYNEGIIFYDQGKYDEAIKAYDNATELNPLNAAAWNNRGGVFLVMRKQNDAIKCFDKSIKISPDNFTPWYNKAIALIESKKSAWNELDTALRLNPQLANTACYWYYRGCEYNLVADSNELPGGSPGGSYYNNAISAFDKALEIDANSWEPWQGKVFAYKGLLRLSEAGQAGKKVLDLYNGYMFRENSLCT